MAYNINKGEILMNYPYCNNITLLATLLYIPLFATPAHVIFIRHGEKSPNEHNINLNSRGFMRSYGLIPLFVDLQLIEGGTLPKNVLYLNNIPMLPAPYGQPCALYAKAQKHSDSSVRSIMTLAPIAEKLSLSVIPYHNKHDDYDKHDPKKFEHHYQSFIKEIINNPDYDAKIVLISWEHNAIPTIMQTLLSECCPGAILPDGLKNPKIFKNFDRIIRFNFKNEKIKTIDNLAQELLQGDSSASSNRYYKVKEKHVEEIKKQ